MFIPGSTETVTDICGNVWSPEAQAKRVIVIEIMYAAAMTAGTRDFTLYRDEHLAARKLADGFGTLTDETEEGITCLHDWSHVRDSTPDGIERIFDYLVQHGYAKGA